MTLFPIAVILMSIAGGLVLVSFVRYFSIKQKYILSLGDSREEMDLPVADFAGFVRRLSGMIRIPTISWTDRRRRDLSQFKRFREELETMYPLVHKQMDREVIGDFGLVFHWKGKNSGKKPVLFLAHYDVVPAQEEGNEKWTHPPFSGLVEDGILWGRGALDIKCQLAFQMEAAETLLAEGRVPDRDIWFAFGGDEEISGMEGAGKIAALFRERNLAFDFVLDEGGIIARDQLAFLKGTPAALIGQAEKGFVTFKVTAPGESGHSSMPPLEGTAVGRLARGIVRLEKRPFPKRLDPVLANMLERFVPHVPMGLGLVFANLWLTRPLILHIFSKNRTTDSLVCTTRAATVCRAGEQENVLPGEAACLVNHRILPGDSIARVREYHRRTLKDDGLEVAQAGDWMANEPLAAAQAGGRAFELIETILAHTHPDAVAVPFLVNGSTDSKHYRGLTENILRFTPLVLTPEDVSTIHGVNERVSLENLEKGLAFYIRLFCHL
ncbi:MAG: M20/M25/M40 family metallo-hydrolase [Desulfobacter sp.]|nr:MAG: M20/M25/M40 family metallo-hydrolase [Desulfobacter sp.]